MSQIILEKIPIIDISGLIIGENVDQKLKIAQEIRSACQNYGFFYIIGHGVRKSLIDDLESISRHFFELPLEIKMRIRMELGGRFWRGFFPVGGELTSGRPDIKEGIYFGSELSDEHPEVQLGTPLHGQNLFPPEIPKMREIVLEYIDQLTKLGHKLMSGIALSLGLEENYFEEMNYTTEPTILFRIFNYPISQDGSENDTESWGVGEHTDYGVLTILKQDQIGGLEVKSQNQWIEAPPVEDSFVCNIGDMLDRITRGLFKSTPHRVKSPKLNKIEQNFPSRISFPFFFDPNFNVVVKPIEGGILTVLKGKNEDNKNERWDRESVHDFEGTYGDYLLNKVSKVFPELKRNYVKSNDSN